MKKTPLDFFIDKISKISTIKITDADKYLNALEDAKKYERNCIEEAYDDGINKVFNRIGAAPDFMIFDNNYFNKTFKSKVK